MKRFLLPVFTAIFLLSQSVALVAALTLDKIGSTTVTGNISSWTYTGTNPIFSGTTDPSASVSISINGSAQSVTADGAGSWSFQPTTLSTAGSYPIIITSGSETKSFTLAIGTTSTTSTDTTTTTTSTTSGQPALPDELPQTGTAQETVLLLAGGFGLMSAGVLFYWKVVPKLLFDESSEVSDDYKA